MKTDLSKLLHARSLRRWASFGGFVPAGIPATPEWHPRATDLHAFVLLGGRGGASCLTKQAATGVNFHAASCLQGALQLKVPVLPRWMALALARIHACKSNARAADRQVCCFTACRLTLWLSGSMLIAPCAAIAGTARVPVQNGHDIRYFTVAALERNPGY